MPEQTIGRLARLRAWFAEMFEQLGRASHAAKRWPLP